MTVMDHLTLDGVMQAPGRKDEDTRGGFQHGGWSIPGNDPVMGRMMGEGMSRGYALLFGRQTYEGILARDCVMSFGKVQIGSCFIDWMERPHAC